MNPTGQQIRARVAVHDAKEALEAQDAIDDEGKSIAILAGHLVVAEVIKDGLGRIAQKMHTRN